MDGPSTKDDNSVKCVAVGDAAVGKTCLLITYTTDKFPAEYVPTGSFLYFYQTYFCTLVFDNYETKLEINGELFTFQLWDTAGAEHYDVLRPLSYGDTDVFLVVYSVIDRPSFENVESKWVKDIKEKGDPGVPFIIVGNKVDLRATSSKPVTRAEGEKLKTKTGAALFFEASAFTQEGLKELFEGCITLAFERLQLRRQKNIHEGEREVSSGRGCCLLF